MMKNKAASSGPDFCNIWSAWVQPEFFFPPANRFLPVRIRRCARSGLPVPAGVKTPAATVAPASAQLRRRHWVCIRNMWFEYKLHRNMNTQPFNISVRILQQLLQRDIFKQLMIINAIIVRAYFIKHARTIVKFKF